MVGTITFSTKRSIPTQWVCSTQYAVGVSAKRSIHTVDLANIGRWGPLPLVQKGHCTPHAVDAVGAQYTVGAQYAVDVSAKRSIHTVDLTNMGGGDCYL